MKSEIYFAKKKVWQDIIARSDYSTVFHTWDWINLLKKYAPKKFGQRVELMPIVAENSRGVVAIPVFRYRLFGKFGYDLLYSPPPKTLTLYSGPLFSTDRQKGRDRCVVELLNTIVNYLLNPRVKYVRIISPPGFYEYRPFVWNKFSVSPLSTYIVQLGSNTWCTFSKNLRKVIRNAERKCDIREGTKKDVAMLIDALRKRGRFVGDSGMVYEVLKTVPSKFFVAEKDGEFLSGTLFLAYGDTIFAWIGNVRPLQRVNGVNELLYWKGMEWGIENGFRRFDMVGAHEKSLFPYKTKFNPEIVLYLSAELKSNTAKFMEMVRVWRAL